jgi:hypothetical protein
VLTRRRGMIWFRTGRYYPLSELETDAWEDGMRAKSGSLCTAAGRYRRSSALAAAVAAVLLLPGSSAWAQGQASGDPASALSLLKTIPINGTAAFPNTQMFSFDISFVDPANGLYYLADRSNAALDVIDTTGNNAGICGPTDTGPDTLCGQIGGSSTGQANFTGDTGVTATSGPDGVAAAFPCVFAGDGNSRLLSFNWSNATKVVTALSTGGKFRVDEMAIDPADSLVIAANNADDPAFTTIVSYNKTTCVLSNPIKTTFTTLPGGHMNTNGIEQPVWDPTTKRFYVSLPEIDGPGNGTGPTGAVARITTGGVIETIYGINYMQPAGLTVGPNGDLLVGSNSVFDLAGKKCSAVVATASTTPRIVPPICETTAGPQEAICNPGRGCTPTNGSLVAVQGVGGGDEVWFNKGDGNYYVTAGNNPNGPVLGVIASVVNTLTQQIPTVYAQQAVGVPNTASFVHSSGTVHSVAACSMTPNGPCATNKVYVPLPANTAYPNCLQGCIAVFGVGP